MQVNAKGEMEIVDGDISRLETIDPNDEDVPEDSKLYIAELKDHMLVEGNEVFGHSKGTLIVGEQMDEEHMEEAEAVEHIIIDGQVIKRAMFVTLLKAISPLYLYYYMFLAFVGRSSVYAITNLHSIYYMM